jgi:hypothetical protein
MDFMNATWRKSTYSYSNGDCVEVGSAPGYVGVRDSKNRAAPPLVFAGPAWSALLTTLRAGAR